MGRRLEEALTGLVAAFVLSAAMAVWIGFSIAAGAGVTGTDLSWRAFWASVAIAGGGKFFETFIPYLKTILKPYLPEATGEGG